MGLHVATGLLQPIVDVLEGAAVGDVEEEEPAHRVAVVGPGDGPAVGVRGERGVMRGPLCIREVER